ncbi:MAG: hypothetical protein AAF533_03540 [Acidobacteriota bacterium]
MPARHSGPAFLLLLTLLTASSAHAGRGGCGDCDVDSGHVDILDALRIAQASAGQSAPQPDPLPVVSVPTTPSGDVDRARTNTALQDEPQRTVAGLACLSTDPIAALSCLLGLDPS